MLTVVSLFLKIVRGWPPSETLPRLLIHSSPVFLSEPLVCISAHLTEDFKITQNKLTHWKFRCVVASVPNFEDLTGFQGTKGERVFPAFQI